MESQPDLRLAPARASLEGLSVGDSVGGFFEFGRPEMLSHFIRERRLPSPPWRFTDDTNMALSIYSILRQYGEINQDALALSFAERFDRTRGYGVSIRGLAARILSGQHWREAVKLSFGGQGSFGNGGAMRVAPVGAYFADDFDAVVENARRSAEVTHAHPEAIAGAVAVAVAAAYAACLREKQAQVTGREFLDLVVPYIPDSEVREKSLQASELASGTDVLQAAKALGNGSRISAQDTVPFALWSAAEYLQSYETAIWTTASVGGDVDTTCAIVGGIVASYTGIEGIPEAWLQGREPLPQWAFNE